jgi:hypothetical protein
VATIGRTIESLRAELELEQRPLVEVGAWNLEATL